MEKTKFIRVDISQSLSTTVNIEVPGDLEEYDSSVIAQYVRDQIFLPDEAIEQVDPNIYWVVDDFSISI